MKRDELITQLKAWGRRYQPRSMERRLMWEAAEVLAEGSSITADAVEEAMGGKLLPWQRERLGG